MKITSICNWFWVIIKFMKINMVQSQVLSKQDGSSRNILVIVDLRVGFNSILADKSAINLGLYYDFTKLDEI